MRFHERLCLERTQAGYKSARAFVKSFDRYSIDMSYANYTRIEKGELTAQLPFVLAIAAALKLNDLRVFLQSYLDEIAPNQAVRTYVNSALTSGNAQASSLSTDGVHEQMLKYNLERRRLLDAKQVRAITKNRDSYWIFLALVLNTKPLGLEEISQHSGIDKMTCKQILAQLVKTGLALKVANGFLAAHPHITFSPGFEERLQELSRSVSSMPGKQPIFWRSVYLRSSENKIREFKDRTNRLAQEFLAQEELNSAQNNQLFQLSLEIVPRDDLNLKN